jgi:Ca2+-binding EF-hand superfamily protein
MNKTRSGFIQFEEFYEMILSWGFDAPEYMIREVFDWLDYDKDNKICFEDLRATAG